MASLSRILRRASSLVERRWIQGSMTDPLGGVCLVGALREAVAECRLYSPDFLDAVHAVFAVLDGESPIPTPLSLRHHDRCNFESSALMAWNDNAMTAQAEVMGLLRRAADAVEREAVRAILAEAAASPAPTPVVEPELVEA